jgi:hypothetical protein
MGVETGGAVDVGAVGTGNVGVVRVWRWYPTVVLGNVGVSVGTWGSWVLLML